MDVGPATITTNCAIREGDGIENKIGFGDGIEVVPRNVLIEGMLIHNQNADEGRFVGDCHYGGLFIVSANGLTIRNSAFSQNVVYNIQVQNFNNAPPPTNVTIENTLFGCAVEWLYVSETICDGQHDIQFNADSRFSNWLIRHNSFVGGVGQYVPGATYSNFRIVGNAGGRIQACFEGMSFAYNAWTGLKCAPTDRSIPRQPYVSAVPGSEDMRLAAGTAASALVPPDSRSRDLALAVDMRGRIRPQRFPRDAGALERDTALHHAGQKHRLGGSWPDPSRDSAALRRASPEPADEARAREDASSTRHLPGARRVASGHIGRRPRRPAVHVEPLLFHPGWHWGRFPPFGCRPRSGGGVGAVPEGARATVRRCGGLVPLDGGSTQDHRSGGAPQAVRRALSPAAIALPPRRSPSAIRGALSPRDETPTPGTGARWADSRGRAARRRGADGYALRQALHAASASR